jgi:cytochrome c oxidase subunit II
MIVSAGWTTLAGGLAVVLITLWLIGRAAPEESTDSVVSRLYRVRGRYFVLLSVVLIAILALTLPMVPYRGAVSAEPDYIVPVTGRIWSWQLGPVEDRNGESLASGEPGIVLPLGATVEFYVTSADYNHGFGIYDDTGVIVAQTQAMPGYVNKLVHTFTKPGTYHVLCMEFCGIGHHAMITKFRVE